MSLVIVADGTRVIVLPSGVVRVVRAVRQGPPGPPGSGGGGSGTVDPRENSFVIAVPGANTVTLTTTPIIGSVDVFINGLRQHRTAFTVAGVSVTLPSPLSLEPGDIVDVAYFA